MSRFQFDAFELFLTHVLAVGVPKLIIHYIKLYVNLLNFLQVQHSHNDPFQLQSNNYYRSSHNHTPNKN